MKIHKRTQSSLKQLHQSKKVFYDYKTLKFHSFSDKRCEKVKKRLAKLGSIEITYEKKKKAFKDCKTQKTHQSLEVEKKNLFRGASINYVVSKDDHV